ncbi:MAG: bifunctional tRNA (5-methylaminomethyl-2-thiouridine)(34)-methyltransferase MnmD/FAD-dependent 5-carboxymethylaminomethyl-2-thiouridine(34) oxidoreductase MnmC [Burkholderiales bacterium]|nr:bifunctional tRNA (5-methylaminomethyl-2-thiouridine)(34)-methyltransferase MnmD/FAD-dependent 5-carboxymethylaminomethyl-2-thiouridine(34) oxidoreductase MnmC [Burkholderiales bacterium]
MSLHTATLIHRDDGTPWSPDYDDVYHSADGGLAQARAVFLAGNGLPQRWAGRRLFCLLETGFGIGINFLASWQAWREDPARCGRLHYFSVEKHPLTAADLAACHARLPEVAALAAQLQAQWPQALPGWHRLSFDEGRVLLTLLFADVAQALPEIDARFDAFYLDGFAPARNPQMWNDGIYRQCSRLAAPGATLATYTTAPMVREGLAQADFVCERLPGYGRKRHRLAGEFRPPHWHRPAAMAASVPPDTPVLVVGAGMAGAAIAETLALRGHPVTVLDAAAGPAGGASGLPAALFHPHLSPDDAILSRLVRKGLLSALGNWDALERRGHVLTGSRGGLAWPAADAAEEHAMRQAVERLRFPDGYMAFLPRNALSENCGLPLRFGGCWFAGCGWLDPRSLVGAQLATAGIDTRFGVRVERLDCTNGIWQAFDAAGRLLAAAPLAVLANSHDSERLVPGLCSLRHIRGQLSRIPAAMPSLRCAIAGAATMVNLGNSLVTGSTFDEDDEQSSPRASDRARNLAGLRALWPESPAPDDGDFGQDFVGFRAATNDHLPLIGALPDLAVLRAQGLQWRGRPVSELPRQPGLYGAFACGSRGLVWASLAAEIIACRIGGEPPPLENDLAAAVDPARFVLRKLRQGRLP